MSTSATETQPSTMLDAALTYAARGWAVFPCQPRGKRPLTANGFKDATTDAEQIRAWWSQVPDANIAIATGWRSNVDVLDVDIKPWKGARGDLSLLALMQHGGLPETRYQRTWSGGLQYFFTHASGVRNSASKVGKHLDIRGDGGYVVVAPSVIEDDGQPEGTYKWENEAQLAPMPEWLLERIKTAGASTRTGRQPKSPNPPGWADALVGGVGLGTRDDTCLRLIGRYSQMRPPMSREEITQFLLAWAENSLDDQGQPFPEATVLEKIERLFSAMERELVDYPLTDAGNAERMVKLYGDKFRWMPGKKDSGEWLAWDGLRWARGSTDAVRRLALDTARQTQAAAARLEQDEGRGGNNKRQIMQHALVSEAARNVDAAVRMARLLDGVSVPAEKFDQHPFLLNVKNGTLDLRTGELRPPAPDDLLTQAMAKS